jgi:methylated-DNA-[protein]-cysteine S-methyltransferase
MPPQRRASLGNGTAKGSSSAAATKTAQPAPPTAAPGAAANKPRRAPTPYERRVYALCSAIPKGRVATYGDMARALTPPSAARAVGQAMRRNPYAPEVPCHRVVAAAGTIGGFSGSWVRGFVGVVALMRVGGGVWGGGGL